MPAEALTDGRLKDSRLGRRPQTQRARASIARRAFRARTLMAGTQPGPILRLRLRALM